MIAGRLVGKLFSLPAKRFGGGDEEDGFERDVGGGRARS